MNSLVFSYIHQAVYSVAMFFLKLDTRIMLIAGIVSNIGHMCLVLFVLGHNKANDSSSQASLARIRVCITISMLIQLIMTASSFSTGVVIGGGCDQHTPLNYLFDAVYGLGFLLMVIYLIERAVGFGAQSV